MNKRFLSVLVFALAVSAIATAVLYRFIAARIVSTASIPSTPVVVASHGLDIGALLKDTDVKLINWPGPVPKGISSRLEEVVGRGVVAAIVEGEPIVDGRLAPRGAGAGLAATIPPGMRAVAVSVNEVVGVAGFVVPGMHVDILVSGNPPGSSAATTGTLTQTLLQNIAVLSAGQNIQKDAEGKPIPVQVVNLLVTPEQAEILSLASQATRIQLVLRNPMDTETAKVPGTAVANLFGGNVKPVFPAQGPPRPKLTVKTVAAVKPPEKIYVPIVVEVFTGNRKAESKFEPEPETKQ